MTTENVKKCDNCGEEHMATSLKVSLGGMQLCSICE
jgi:formylmethanofuran dehydrogenase subunit E